MNQKLIAEIGKSQRLEIINKLKRTQGLPVRELATMLGMSSRTALGLGSRASSGRGSSRL